MNNSLYKIGFRAGMLAFASNLAFVFVQTLQLLGYLHYPYDEIFIYGFSLCIVIPFLIEMLALYYITPADKKDMEPRGFNLYSYLFCFCYCKLCCPTGHCYSGKSPG